MRYKVCLAMCLALIIIAVGATGCDTITPPTRTSSTSGFPTSSQNTGIWVTGTGEVNVSPDIAILEVGVEAQESNVAAAQAKATAAMAKVTDTMMNRGVAAEDIQTQYFRIRERTRWNEATDEEVVTGYQVTNRVTAKIRSLPIESTTLDYKTGLIVDDVVQAGGDLIRIDGLSFSVDDPTEYYDEAREKATADAEEKAKKLAKQTGVSLGAPMYIAEGVQSSPILEDMKFSVQAVPAPAPVIAETPLSPGEITITLTVQIAYGIR